MATETDVRDTNHLVEGALTSIANWARDDRLSAEERLSIIANHPFVRREALSASPAPVGAWMDRIVAERQRQIAEEGWSAGHDDQHDGGEMLRAAVIYFLHAKYGDGFLSMKDGAPLGWPWEREWWKPKGRERDLIRAGALCLAEEDRVNRATSRSAGKRLPVPIRPKHYPPARHKLGLILDALAASPSPAPTPASPPDQTRKEGDETVHDGRHSPRAEQSAQAKTPSSLGGNVTTPPHPSPPDAGEYDGLPEQLRALAQHIVRLANEAGAGLDAADSIPWKAATAIEALERRVRATRKRWNHLLNRAEAAEADAEAAEAKVGELEGERTKFKFEAGLRWRALAAENARAEAAESALAAIMKPDRLEAVLRNYGIAGSIDLANRIRALAPKEPGNGN